jgi:hypothetical protein
MGAHAGRLTREYVLGPGAVRVQQGAGRQFGRGFDGKDDGHAVF